MYCLGDNAAHLVAPPLVGNGDTCGAGDCFAAAAAAALADGALPSEAVALGVDSAAGFVAAGGAAAFDPAAGTSPADALADAPGDVPAGALPGANGEQAELDRLLERVRRQGGVLVATGGCFDLLHAGHIATLQAARALGDCLLVCLNSDESVRRLKGVSRPLQPAADRARVLLALECVDAVVVFDEDTPANALRQIRPDLWAKGGDYSGVPLPESAVLAEWGGEAVTVPYLRGRSTSALVQLAAQPGPAR
jgi:rfaE bifunctional protein nucleotidyltransferase chain/domain